MVSNISTYPCVHDFRHEHLRERRERSERQQKREEATNPISE